MAAALHLDFSFPLSLFFPPRKILRTFLPLFFFFSQKNFNVVFVSLLSGKSRDPISFSSSLFLSPLLPSPSLPLPLRPILYCTGGLRTEGQGWQVRGIEI